MSDRETFEDRERSTIKKRGELWRPKGWAPIDSDLPRRPETDGERKGRLIREASHAASLKRTAHNKDQAYDPRVSLQQNERLAQKMSGQARDKRSGKLLRVPDPRFMSDAELVAMGQVLAAAHKYDWIANARPDQLEPEDYAIWLMLAGRGWGKTRTLTETVRKWAEERPGTRIGIIAQDHRALRDTVFEGVVGLRAVIPPYLWDEKAYKRGLGDVSVILTNGSIITGYTAGQPDTLRGPEMDCVAFDEFAAWPKNLADETMSNARMTLRASENPRIIIATTPKRIPHLMKMVKQASDPKARIVITKGRTVDNTALSEQALADLHYQYADTRKGRQELDGELLTDVEGTLWTLEGVDHAVWPEFTDDGEENPLPVFDMVITGIDPSGSAKGDATGIVTLGYNHSLRQIFALECKSTNGLADHRYNEACLSAFRCKANLIVVEGSYGADNCILAVEKQWKHLVDTGVIDTVQPRAVLSNLKGDKVAKVSPLAALYEQQLKGGSMKIWHAKATLDNGLTMLEDEMTSWAPVDESGKAMKSPNSIDAFAHAGRRAMKDLGMETTLSRPSAKRRINRGYQHGR